MVPGQAPFDALAAALGRIATLTPPDIAGELAASDRSLDEIAREIVPDGTGVVVVIDQFEELFTQTIDDRERRAFLRMIVDAAAGSSGAVRLVATLRADYFDRPLAYPGIGDAIKGRTVAIGAMSDAELADAVRLPAEGVGIDVEPQLVERLTADAAVQPGALPLVQHTMAELFARRQSNVITLAAFEESGGLAGAISRRAEAIYVEFDEQRREATRRTFLRLVTVSEDRGDTRRRVRRTELDQLGISADDLQAVLDEYGRHRLLTFDRDPTSRTPTVEVAHESLIAEWERFAGWVDDAREDLLTRRRLETAASDWMSSGSDPSFLYGGGRLELTESWVVSSGFELTDDERRFLATSRERSIAIASCAPAAVGSSSARSLRPWSSRSRALRWPSCNGASAERQANRADHAGTLAESRRISTQALVEDDYDQALLLALEGRHLDDSPESRDNLLATIQRSPYATSVIRSDTQAFLDLGFTADGSLLAGGTGGPSTLSKYDVTTREPTGAVPTEEARLSSAVSPDGRLAAMSSTGEEGIARRSLSLTRRRCPSSVLPCQRWRTSGQDAFRSAPTADISPR